MKRKILALVISIATLVLEITSQVRGEMAF